MTWAASRQNQQNGICTQRRLRSAWASAQCDQSNRCPHKESLGSERPIDRKAKLLVRLGGCPGWSESSLGAHAMPICWFCHEAAHVSCENLCIISKLYSARYFFFFFFFSFIYFFLLLSLLGWRHFQSTYIYYMWGILKPLFNAEVSAKLGRAS